MRRIVPGGPCWRSSHQDNLGAAILPGLVPVARLRVLDGSVHGGDQKFLGLCVYECCPGWYGFNQSSAPPPLSLIKIVYQSPSAIFETCDSNQIMKWAGCFQVLQSLLVDGEARMARGCGKVEVPEQRRLIRPPACQCWIGMSGPWCW